MSADVGFVLLERLKRMLTEAGFSFDDPDPMLVWEIFRAFAREPVAANNDIVFFTAREVDLPPRDVFGLEFKRAFGEWSRDRDLLILELVCTCQGQYTFKTWPVTLRSRDFASLDDFFEAVEFSQAFRLASTLSPWVCRDPYLMSQRW
jgi:hypothetical protein